MSPQIPSLIVFAENIHLNLNRPTKIAVCAPGFRLTNIEPDCLNCSALYGLYSLLISTLQLLKTRSNNKPEGPFSITRLS